MINTLRKKTRVDISVLISAIIMTPQLVIKFCILQYPSPIPIDLKQHVFWSRCLPKTKLDGLHYRKERYSFIL